MSRVRGGKPPQNNMGTLVYVNPDVNQGPRRISMIYGNGSLPPAVAHGGTIEVRYHVTVEPLAARASQAQEKVR